MAHYAIYVLAGATNDVISSKHVKARDDMAALDKAESFLGNDRIIEIWRYGRRIAVLDSHSDAPLRL